MSSTKRRWPLPNTIQRTDCSLCWITYLRQVLLWNEVAAKLLCVGRVKALTYHQCSNVCTVSWATMLVWFLTGLLIGWLMSHRLTLFTLVSLSLGLCWLFSFTSGPWEFIWDTRNNRLTAIWSLAKHLTIYWLEFNGNWCRYSWSPESEF